MITHILSVRVWYIKKSFYVYTDQLEMFVITLK